MLAALQASIGRVNAIRRGIRWFVQIIKNYVLDYLRAINWFELFEKAKYSMRLLVDPTGGAGLSTSISHDQLSVAIAHANANASSNASSAPSTPGTDGRHRSKSTVAPIDERERARLMQERERVLERDVERAHNECDLMDVDPMTATRLDATDAQAHPPAPQPQAPANPLDLQNGYRDVLFGAGLVVTIASLFGIGAVVSRR